MGHDPERAPFNFERRQPLTLQLLAVSRQESKPKKITQLGRGGRCCLCTDNSAGCWPQETSIRHQSWQPALSADSIAQNNATLQLFQTNSVRRAGEGEGQAATPENVLRLRLVARPLERCPVARMLLVRHPGCPEPLGSRGTGQL